MFMYESHVVSVQFTGNSLTSAANCLIAPPPSSIIIDELRVWHLYYKSLLFTVRPCLGAN